MPTKNWLIRTKSNHILGPVSKDKVIELYHNGSVRPEDEICSGNGFWFFLREKDQVEAYLLGDKKQSFNPIAEAMDVLTAHPDRKNVERPVEEDITLVKGISLDALKDEVPPPPAPRSQMKVERAPAIVQEEIVSDRSVEPERPVTQTPRTVPRLSVISTSPTPISPGKVKKKTLTTPTEFEPAMAVPRKRFISDRTLMIGSIVILIFLAGMLYYRKRILQEFIHSATSVILPTVYAQDAEGELKKKDFLILWQFPKFTHSN